MKKIFERFLFITIVLSMIFSLFSAQGIPVKETLHGDVDKDGKVLAADYMLIKSVLKGDRPLAEFLVNSDVNYDNRVTSIDYILVKKIISGQKFYLVKNEPLAAQPAINDTGKKITYTVSGVFSDNMVIQRDKVINVWGWSNNKGGYIYGELFGEKRYAKIDNNGQWMLQFSPHKYTTIGTTLKIYPKNGNITTFNNILIGDVWLVSGQSNAEYMFSQMAEYYTDSYDYIDVNDNIRLLKIDKSDNSSLKVTGLQKDFVNKNNKWTKTTLSEVSEFSALGYMFAKEISEYSDVPQGMVMAAAGGCILQEFMDPTTGSNYDNKNAIWTYEPNSIYKYYIAPFKNMTLRGVLFYQGESNQGEKFAYYDKLVDFVNGWRREFDSDFIFINFQCTSHILFGDLPKLKVAQLEAYKVIDDSYIIPTNDAGWGNKGDGEDRAHPYDKITIGKRAAHLALSEVFRLNEFKSDYANCPMPINATWTDSKVIIDFENVGDGLKTYSGDLVGFKFANAKEQIIYNITPEAKIIDKNTVEVYLPEDTSNIISVCYAREPRALFEHANLLNSFNVPAPTFELYKEG